MNYSGCLDPVGRPTDGFRFAPRFFSRPSSNLSPFLRAARLRSQGSRGPRLSVSCDDVDSVGDRARLPGSSRAPCTAVSSASSLLHSCGPPSFPIDVDPPGRQVETLRVRIRSSLTAMLNHIQLRCHKCSRRYMRPEMHSRSQSWNYNKVAKSRVFPITISRHYLLQRKAKICFYHKHLSLLVSRSTWSAIPLARKLMPLRFINFYVVQEF